MKFWTHSQTHSIIQDIVRKLLPPCKLKNKKMLNKFNITEIYAHNISAKYILFFINGHPFYDQINHSIVKITLGYFFWSSSAVCLKGREYEKKSSMPIFQFLNKMLRSVEFLPFHDLK